MMESGEVQQKGHFHFPQTRTKGLRETEIERERERDCTGLSEGPPDMAELAWL